MHVFWIFQNLSCQSQIESRMDLKPTKNESGLLAIYGNGMYDLRQNILCASDLISNSQADHTLGLDPEMALF